MAKRIVLSQEEKEIIAKYAKREISATVLRITGNTISLGDDDAIRHVEF